MAYGPGRYDPVYEENNWDYPVSIVRWTENRNMAAFLRLVADGDVDLGAIPVGQACRWPRRRGCTRGSRSARLPLTGVLCYHDSARTG